MQHHQVSHRYFDNCNCCVKGDDVSWKCDSMMAMEEEVAVYRSFSVDKALRVVQRTHKLCLDCYFEGDFQPLTFHIEVTP